MAFFHHQTIKIYTLALLETFNDIEIQNLASDGVTIKTSTIPIKFSSREKAIIIDEYETKEVLKGNYNILPKMSLIFNGLEIDPGRSRNKFLKINKLINGELIQFQNNSVPYNFNFELICKARGMSEASMIIEQISSYFNPSYALKVKEIPIQDEYSTILLGLEGIQIEQEEYEEFSRNIVTITFPITLKGNIYPAIKDQTLVKSILWYLNRQIGNEYQRASLIEFDGEVTKYDFGPNFGENPPIINGIEPHIISVQDKVNLQCLYIDKDNKPKEMKYIWVLLEGQGTLGTSTEVVEISSLGYNKIIVTCVDNQGNQSNSFTKEIIVIQDTIQGAIDLDPTLEQYFMYNPVTEGWDLLDENILLILKNL